MQTGAPVLTPDEAAATGILEILNKDELQNLLDDDSKLVDLINDTSQVKKLHSDKEMLMVSNKSMADYNMSQKPKLENLKSQLALKYEDANKLKTDLAMQMSKLDTHKGDDSLETVAVLLKTAATKSEEEAEEIATDFCDKKIDVESFIEQFIARRSLANLRMIKSQKMPQLMRELQTTQNYSYNNHHSSSEPSMGNYMGGNAPYPQGQNNTPYPATYSMPQAGYYNIS